MHYGYDGSYAGLLSLLYQLFRNRRQPANIHPPSAAQNSSLFPPEQHSCEPRQADALLMQVRRHLGAAVECQLRHAFLSRRPGIELQLYHYLALGWRLRQRLDDQLTHPAVRSVHQAARFTQHEVHRFKGLLRFAHCQLADNPAGLYYGRCRPDADIIALLAPHFCRRLAGQQWLIEDVGRQTAVLCDGQHWALGQLSLQQPAAASDEELQWQTLWRTFHHHSAIPERRNPRLQRQFLPLKYREFLCELQPPAAVEPESWS